MMKPFSSALLKISANAVVVLQSLSDAFSNALGSHSCIFCILFSFYIGVNVSSALGISNKSQAKDRRGDIRTDGWVLSHSGGSI